MTINHVGSMVNLAKQIKMDLNGVGEFTQMRTATVLLLMDTLIDLGTPKEQIIHANAAKTVADMISHHGQQ